MKTPSSKVVSLVNPNICVPPVTTTPLLFSICIAAFAVAEPTKYPPLIVNEPAPAIRFAYTPLILI